jgi:chromosome segregation ATPase
LRELAEMRVQVEDKSRLKHTAAMLDAAAIEAHNSLWEEATDWQAQLDAVLGSDLGNIDRGNAAQEHIAGIQAEPGRAERDVIGLRTQEEAKLERAQKEILGLQAQHAISASHIKNAWKEIVELQAQLTSSSAQHGNVTADLEIARAEVAKLQAELMFLTEQHGGSAANLESVKQEINRLEAELLQYRSSAVDLQSARNEIVGLQAQMKYVIGQHGASIAQLASA